MPKVIKGLTVALLFIAVSINIYAVNITGVRLWQAPDNTRVVFDLSEGGAYKYFTLTRPYRLVIDIDAGRLSDKTVIDDIDWSNTNVTKLRYSKNKKRLRFVFDLKNDSEYKIFNLEPNNIITNHRIVLDLANKDKANSGSVATTFKKQLPVITNIPSVKDKKFTVIIDPGHGGDDPGAIGRRGTREKDVVLKIANYLKQYINKDPNMSAVLTRTGDYYIGLRGRTEKARLNQADLFISIHADGFKDRRAKGASVFVLSDRGASSELAKWIADHENSSDLVGGVSLDNKDTMLATVLLDLSQTASSQSSYRVAGNVLDEIAKVTYLHKTTVEKAGFVVLKSPDIPSLLVETGFISNRRGEANLRTSAYQRKIAYSIFKGIEAYFKTQPRPNFDDVIMHAKK